jgi:hypothetical protein
VASPSISARVVWDNELRYGTLDRFFAPARVEDTFFEAESAVIDATDHFSWVTRLYRGYLRYQGEHAQLTVGRQRLAWGVGRLWNPLDRFSFVPPLAIEADQSLGIDSIDARWRFNGFDYVQAVYAPGNSSSEARYALRYQAVVRDVDVSALTGVFGEAFVAGFDLAGNLADAAVRLEVAYTDPGQDVWPIGAATPSEPDPFWQVVVSGDYNFDLGSGLYVLVEHLYNGNALGFGSGQAGALLPLFGSSAIPPPGVPPAVRGPFVAAASPAAFGSSLVVSGSRHLTGVQGSYEFSGVLRTDLLVIWDWDGSSAVFAPSLAYLGWNEVELTLGAQLFAGPERSEYGSREPLVFLVAEFFF